jgi:acyl-CoA reductase-like NAD-dependent aldehyde dehydrogenase
VLRAGAVVRAWLDRSSARGIPVQVVNPATEETIAELEQADVEEADAAVARAKAAFPGWRAVDVTP